MGKRYSKDEIFLFLIIMSAILGLGFGFLLKYNWNISPVMITYIGLPGKLVIRAFMMILVPLIVASLSTSITEAKLGESKKLILFTLLLFIASSTFTSIFGMILMFITKPGVKKFDESIINVGNLGTIDTNDDVILNFSQENTIYDLFINMIPENIISATFMIQYTGLVPIDSNNLTMGYKKVDQQAFRTNFLGLCVFSLILGFAVLSLDSKSKIVKKTLKEVNDIIMHIIVALMQVMPIGMFSWMCVEAIKMESPKAVLTQLVWFLVTSFIAFFCHLFIICPAIYTLIVHKNPFKFYFNLLPAIVIAFGSASSAFTLPMTIKCMEEHNKLSKRMSRIILPLGMSLHMNGFSMYYPMVTIFVAQMHGIAHTSIFPIISLCLFSVMMSIAMPGIPSGGSSIITFVAHCNVIGINNPHDVLVYIMTIDWLMERIRTIMNITGTCFVAAIMETIFSNMDVMNVQDFQMISVADNQLLEHRE